MMCHNSGKECARERCMAWKAVPGVLEEPACVIIAGAIGLAIVGENILNTGGL